MYLNDEWMAGALRGTRPAEGGGAYGRGVGRPRYPPLADTREPARAISPLDVLTHVFSAQYAAPIALWGAAAPSKNHRALWMIREEMVKMGAFCGRAWIPFG